MDRVRSFIGNSEVTQYLTQIVNYVTGILKVSQGCSFVRLHIY